MRLRNMTWENGAPMVVISPITSDDEERGHALVMIFLTPSGLLMPHRILENIISARGIAVRTGFFCNPGTSLHIMAPYMDMGKNGLSLELFVNRYIPRMSKMGRLHEVIERNPHQGLFEFHLDWRRIVRMLRHFSHALSRMVGPSPKRWSSKPKRLWLHAPFPFPSVTVVRAEGHPSKLYSYGMHSSECRSQNK
jgi:hypothetical protein